MINVYLASADKSIKVWDGSKCARTILGHEDVVRSLARVNSNAFISSSNDG